MKGKNEATVNLKTGRFDNIDSAVNINKWNITQKQISPTNQDSFQFCTLLLTLLMMTAESMLSKRPVLRSTAPLFFLTSNLLLPSKDTQSLTQTCFGVYVDVTI